MRFLFPGTITLLAILVACNKPTETDSDTDDGLTDRDGDLYLSDVDCNDDDPRVFPGAPEDCTDGQDNDCDGEIDTDEDWCSDSGDTDAEPIDDDGDTFESDVDCDDGDPAIYPGAPEYCNGIDDDCEGGVDEVDAFDALTWYIDRDGDGHGDPGEYTVACEAPEGFVSTGDDCDDNNADISPSDVEVCNGGIDDDCDQLADDDDPSLDRGTATTWHADQDGDGYGAPFLTALTCVTPSGYLLDNTDCDDTEASTHPGANEYCDLVDNNCDGVVDEPEALDALDWYADVDGDGYGDPGTLTLACWESSGFVSDHTDCDDGNGSAHPNQDELCSTAFDDDCDGLVNDTSAVDVTAWYRDNDGDSYTNNGVRVYACTAPSGYGPQTIEDCDDNEPSAYPSGPEDDRDLIDNDCDGIRDEEITFTLNQTLSLGAGTNPHYIIDLDVGSSNNRDLAIATYGSGSVPGQVHIYLGDGAGSFTYSDSINAGYNTRSLSYGFVNGGSNRDIVAVNTAIDGGTPHAWSLYTDNNGQFTSNTLSTDVSGTAPEPRAVAALEDCNGAGTHLEFIAVGDNDNSEISFWANSSGTYTYTGVSVSTGNSGTNSGPIRFREVDVNGDGVKDLISANGLNNTVSVVTLGYTGSCTSITASNHNYSISSFNRVSGVALGDFDNDGDQDIAAVSKNGDALHLLINDGTGAFSDGGSFDILADHGLSNCQPEGVAVGDFNPDNYDDIAVICQDSNRLAFYMGYGDGTFDITTNRATGTSPRELTVDDFDGDGEDDIAVVNDGGDDNVHVLLCN